MSASKTRAPKVLFVCVQNACRSQMAQGFALQLGLDAHSAGSAPSGQVNPKAIASMAAVGIALDDHASTGLDELRGVPFDATVTMGCGDACPFVPAPLREDWNIPDPKDMDSEAFAEVRELVRRQVTELAERLRAAAE
ncbi:MAG: hypothetical protein DHS20C15_23620 [Planctomycetota bacterium]|nr:MAG: hypothetical protein DHS20C15_23620 [Planctomycetota bacterium]